MNRTELREKLNKIDCENCNKYDLVNLFESVKLSNEDLNKLSRIVNNEKAVYNFLNEKAYPSAVFAKSDIVKSPKKLAESKKATKGKKSLTEGFNVDDEAQKRIIDSDIDYTVAEDSNGDDFLIVGSWDDVQKIQKAIDPSFSPSDKYDTEVLDSSFDGEWGFQDEYTTCDMCGKVIQTSPDSYSWTADYFADYESGEMVCGDCVREDPANYLNSLINNPESANTILDRQGLKAEGFELIEDDYENGWYDRSDNPKEILEKALEEYPNAEFIFSISGQEQFRTNFELWGRGLNKTLGEGGWYGSPRQKEYYYEAEYHLPDYFYSQTEYDIPEDEIDDEDVEGSIQKYIAKKAGKGNNKKYIDGIEVLSIRKYDEDGDYVDESLRIEESMSSAVERQTLGYKKTKGQIQCNGGAQAKEVEDLLKAKYDNVTTQKGKGGKVIIKFSKNESLEESVSIPRNAKRIKVKDFGVTSVLEKTEGGDWRVVESEKDELVGKLIGTNFLRTFDSIEVLETDPNYAPKRTKEVKVLQGYYDLGWEDLITYSAPYDSKEIKDDLKSYRENENRAFRVITRRVPIKKDESLSESNDAQSKIDELEERIQKLVKRYQSAQKQYHGDSALSKRIEAEISGLEDEQRKLRATIGKEESLSEDTIKQGSGWVNKGKEGTHGKFKTKKEADSQRKAMFARGFKEGVEDDITYIELKKLYPNRKFYFIGDRLPELHEKIKSYKETIRGGQAAIVVKLYEHPVEGVEDTNNKIDPSDFQEQLKEDKAKDTMRSVVAKWRSRRSNKDESVEDDSNKEKKNNKNIAGIKHL